MPQPLHAYNDESYTDLKVFIVAGYVGRQCDWRGVEGRWRRRLHAFGVKEFHAADCAHGRDEYLGRELSDRIRLQEDLARLLATSPLRAAATAIKLEDWQLVAEEMRAARPRLDTPYHLAFEHQVTLIAQAPFSRRAAIEFVFDKIAKRQRGAEEVFHSMQGDTSPEFEFVRRFSDVRFADSHDEVGLQAADLLAYECKKHLEVAWGISTPQPHPRFFSVLLGDEPNLGDRVRFFEAGGLQTYLERIKRPRPAPPVSGQREGLEDDQQSRPQAKR